VSVGTVSKFGGALALSSSTRRIKHTVCHGTARGQRIPVVLRLWTSVIHTMTARPYPFLSPRSPKSEASRRVLRHPARSHWRLLRQIKNWPRYSAPRKRSAPHETPTHTIACGHMQITLSLLEMDARIFRRIARLRRRHTIRPSWGLSCYVREEIWVAGLDYEERERNVNLNLNPTRTNFAFIAPH